MAGPETKYTTAAGGVTIAYQVMGDGPLDLVIVPGVISHVEFFHEMPGYTAWLQRLAQFARVITFDKRGNGLSDRITGAPTLEDRMDDVRAVMDAVGSERAALFGFSEGGPLAMLFAATYPERTVALITCGAFAKAVATEDCPGLFDGDVYDVIIQSAIDHWGEGAMAISFTPSLMQDPGVLELWGKAERLSGTPTSMRDVWDMNRGVDVREVLPLVRVPTLVINRRNEICSVDNAEYIASHIRGARLLITDGMDHAPWVGGAEEVTTAIHDFLVGEGDVFIDLQRSLATVLLTDIVESTAQASRMGDTRWRQLLDTHDEIVARQVLRHSGRVVKSTGDGTLATFDGPARAIRCATSMRHELLPHGLVIRAGLHTGEIELRGLDVGGIAVHIAARVEATAAPGEVLVSRTVTDLVSGSGIRFDDRGEYSFKGIERPWHLFAVAS